MFEMSWLNTKMILKAIKLMALFYILVKEPYDEWLLSHSKKVSGLSPGQTAGLPVWSLHALGFYLCTPASSHSPKQTENACFGQMETHNCP